MLRRIIRTLMHAPFVTIVYSDEFDELDPEICAITGHSLASATNILRHYLALHPEQADNAIGKLNAWLTAKETVN